MQQIISNPMQDIQPAWSPDSEMLAFVHDQRMTGRFVYAGKCEVMLYDMRMHIQQPLASVAEGVCDTAPQWRPVQ
jgi:Tol biopolymer transport system component